MHPPLPILPQLLISLISITLTNDLPIRILIYTLPFSIRSGFSFCVAEGSEDLGDVEIVK